MNRIEYQKTINLLDSATNQLFEYKIKDCVEISDDRNGVYTSNREIKLKLNC